MPPTKRARFTNAQPTDRIFFSLSLERWKNLSFFSPSKKGDKKESRLESLYEFRDRSVTRTVSWLMGRNYSSYFVKPFVNERSIRFRVFEPVPRMEGVRFADESRKEENRE